MHMALVRVSARVSRRQKVAAGVVESQDEPATAQEDYRGDGPGILRGLVASADRTLPSARPGIGSAARRAGQSPSQIARDPFT